MDIKKILGIAVLATTSVIGTLLTVTMQEAAIDKKVQKHFDDLDQLTKSGSCGTKIDDVKIDEA